MFMLVDIKSELHILQMSFLFDLEAAVVVARRIKLFQKGNAKWRAFAAIFLSLIFIYIARYWEDDVPILKEAYKALIGQPFLHLAEIAVNGHNTWLIWVTEWIRDVGNDSKEVG